MHNQSLGRSRLSPRNFWYVTDTKQTGLLRVDLGDVSTKTSRIDNRDFSQCVNKHILTPDLVTKWKVSVETKWKVYEKILDKLYNSHRMYRKMGEPNMWLTMSAGRWKVHRRSKGWEMYRRSKDSKDTLLCYSEEKYVDLTSLVKNWQVLRDDTWKTQLGVNVVELSKAEWSAEPEPNHENNNPLNKILLQVHKHELHLIKTGGWTCDVCGRTSNSICE